MMSANWSQLWHGFVAATAQEPPPLAVGIWVGLALILVMAAEGLLVSFFPRHVFRRMRLLPTPPLQQPEEEIRSPLDLRGGMRIEPTFPAPSLAPAPFPAPTPTRPVLVARRSAPVSDLRSRPVQTLKVIRNTPSEN